MSLSRNYSISMLSAIAYLLIPACFAREMVVEPTVPNCTKTVPKTTLSLLAPRVFKDWAPSASLSKPVSIQASVADDMRIFNVEIAESSGDAQIDADCLQAVLGAATFETGSKTYGFTLAKWAYQFDKSPQRQNLAVKQYFDQNPDKKQSYICIFRIPFDVVYRYPQLFSEKDLLSPANIVAVRNIKIGRNTTCGAIDPLTFTTIRDYYGRWQAMFNCWQNPSKSEITAFASLNANNFFGKQ